MSARLVLIALLVTGCASALPAPSTIAPAAPTLTHDLTVNLLVRGSYGVVAQDGEGCETRAHLKDIKVGAEFTVRDGAGTIIGLGTLTGAQYREQYECLFSGMAQVPDVPIYSVEVGQRGTVNFTRAELESNGWRAEMSLDNE